MRRPWLLVSGGVHQRGGQDKANAALARFLLARGNQVTLVCHEADAEFETHKNCRVILSPLVLRSYFLSQFTHAARGRAVARTLTQREPKTQVVVNGGIFPWPGVNWLHCVHHAWELQSPCRHNSVKERWQNTLFRRVAKRQEQAAVRAASLVICNSQRTRRDAECYLGVSPERLRMVYLGCDLSTRPPSSAERERARSAFGLEVKDLAIVFVGGLDRDDHKGFTRMYAAWIRMIAESDWPGQLLVAGGGNQLAWWQERARRDGSASRIKFFGFTNEIPTVLAAADLLVSPARYEAYGLNVQEAICRGVPTFVTEVAGVAERYPQSLHSFLLANDDNSEELVRKILAWRTGIATWREEFRIFGDNLRAFDWDAMAREMVALSEA